MAVGGARPKHYTDLLVWQRGIVLARNIYKLTARFPAEERFGLTARMRRAAVSGPSNIAEGQARHGTREFLQFLSRAEGSLAELETQVLLSINLGFAKEADVSGPLRQIDEMQKMLVSMRRKLAALSPLAIRHSPLRASRCDSPGSQA